jgi:hypothetical protein
VSHTPPISSFCFDYPPVIWILPFLAALPVRNCANARRRCAHVVARRRARSPSADPHGEDTLQIHWAMTGHLVRRIPVDLCAVAVYKCYCCTFSIDPHARYLGVMLAFVPHALVRRARLSVHIIYFISALHGLPSFPEGLKGELVTYDTL